MELPKDWSDLLKSEFKEDYYTSLMNFVEQEYSNFKCYPSKELIFKSFHDCSLNNLKLVIIGQDPYHGFGQANGLSFSVNLGMKHPPSLVNIFKELEEDLKITYPISGDLSSWAKQGVLLLNAILTVRESEAGSHQNKGWEKFTDAVINQISLQKENIVFMLWGGYAKKKGAKIDREKHLVLESGHPSPLSANRGYWFGNGHFSKANDYLLENGLNKIDWEI